MEDPSRNPSWILGAGHLLVSLSIAWGILFDFESSMILHSLLLFALPSAAAAVAMYRIARRSLGGRSPMLIAIGAFLVLGLLAWVLSPLDGVPWLVYFVAWPGLLAWELLCWDLVPCPGN